MREYGFLLARILPYIYDTVPIRENTGQWKRVFSHVLCNVKKRAKETCVMFDRSVSSRLLIYWKKGKWAIFFTFGNGRKNTTNKLPNFELEWMLESKSNKSLFFFNKRYLGNFSGTFCYLIFWWYDMQTCNHVHNISRLFDSWANFRFTTWETK